MGYVLGSESQVSLKLFWYCFYTIGNVVTSNREIMVLRVHVTKLAALTGINDGCILFEVLNFRRARVARGKSFEDRAFIAI